MITEVILIAMVVNVMFLSFMLVSVLKSQQKHIELESVRYENLAEKLILGFQGEDAAKSLSQVESTRESLRQHAKTFDIELDKYKRVLKKTPTTSESTNTVPEMFLDQAGKQIEIVDLES